MNAIAIDKNAALLACEAHWTQRDKAGAPYVWHLFRVGYSLGEDKVAAAVGFLHDIVEDCAELPGIMRRFETEFSGVVSESVHALTRGADESYSAYIERIAGSSDLVRRVKIADLRDNLRPERLGELNPEEATRLRAKYRPVLDRLLQTRGHKTTIAGGR